MLNLPNSTQIPNEIINGWLPKLSEGELKVVIIVARQTLGWIGDPKTGMRKEEDWMTNEQLRQKTGIKHKRTLSSAIKGLIDKKLIEIRTEDGEILNTAQKRQVAGRQHKDFYYRLPLKKHGTKSIPRHGAKGVPRHGLKSSYNKTNSYKTNSLQKNIIKRGKYSSLKNILEEDLVEIAAKYGVPLAFVKLQLEALINYCEAHGRRYKNYKAALRNFVISAAQKMVERRGQDDSKRGIDAT